jgi:2-polyprenyl-3-methyl-5-hydroxy-6-metoxy-1,4-benzoquinol methylase
MHNTLALQDIVPEYSSRNPLVRWLFHRRLDVALRLGDLGGTRRLEVLDLGCGEAKFLKLCSQRYPQNSYAGWDVHPGIMQLSVAGVEFMCVDIRQPRSIPIRTFDRIFCLDVLEHFESLEVVLGVVRRLLKFWGLLVISELTESWLYQFGRWVVKGTASAVEGLVVGFYYHNAQGVHK